MSLRHVQSLTNRERELIPLIAEGLLNKEVARRLGISEGTVKVHLHNIFGKTGVKNRTALVALALAEFFEESRRSVHAAASREGPVLMSTSRAADHLPNMAPARNAVYSGMSPLGQANPDV
jgi:DNA-binding CsgD family transcriptional regulator